MKRMIVSTNQIDPSNSIKAIADILYQVYEQYCEDTPDMYSDGVLFSIANKEIKKLLEPSDIRVWKQIRQQLQSTYSMDDIYEMNSDEFESVVAPMLHGSAIMASDSLDTAESIQEMIHDSYISYKNTYDDKEIFKMANEYIQYSLDAAANRLWHKVRTYLERKYTPRAISAMSPSDFEHLLASI